MPLCEECNKPLRIFKKREDFDGRELHFKCWKKRCNELLNRIILQEFTGNK